MLTSSWTRNKGEDMCPQVRDKVILFLEIPIFFCVDFFMFCRFLCWRTHCCKGNGNDSYRQGFEMKGALNLFFFGLFSNCRSTRKATRDKEDKPTGTTEETKVEKDLCYDGFVQVVLADGFVNVVPA